MLPPATKLIIASCLACMQIFPGKKERKKERTTETYLEE
jgi:hypothetical protein